LDLEISNHFQTIFFKTIDDAMMEQDGKSVIHRFKRRNLGSLAVADARRVPLPHLAAAPPELLQQFVSPIPRNFFALLMQRV
jgi:hypothetical protein